MKFVKASYEILTDVDGQEILKRLETATRVAYKSENKIKDGSAEELMKKIVHKLHHESVLEHESVSVRIICDRGVSHELVRHRLASFTQESTRYCNYTKNIFDNEMRFIVPCWFDETLKEKMLNGEFDTLENIDKVDIENKGAFVYWWSAMQRAEHLYGELIKNAGWSAQQARSILPNSLKTEIVTTANLREWRTIFKLRTNPSSHAQMREITIPLLEEFKRKIPIIFDDL